MSYVDCALGRRSRESRLDHLGDVPLPTMRRVTDDHLVFVIKLTRAEGRNEEV